MSQEQMMQVAFIVMVALPMTFLLNAAAERYFGQKSIGKYIKLIGVPIVIAVFIFLIMHLPEPFMYAAGCVPFAALVFIVWKYYVSDKEPEDKEPVIKARKYDRKRRSGK